MVGSTLHGAEDLGEVARGPVGGGRGFPLQQLFKQFRSDGLTDLRGKLVQEFDAALVAGAVLVVLQGLVDESVDLRVEDRELLFVIGTGHEGIVGPCVGARKVRGGTIPSTHVDGPDSACG